MARSNIPLWIFCCYFPQNACIQQALESSIVNEIACRLLRSSDIDLVTTISEKFGPEGVRKISNFLFKNCFNLGYNISSYEIYMVTKSWIFPQRKHGSFPNFNFCSWDTHWLPNFFSQRFVHVRARNMRKAARTCLRARIFTKKNLVINVCLIKKLLKFDKDPCFCWGNISFLVTMLLL